MWSRRFGLARVRRRSPSPAITVGWALAQDPYLLPARAHARRGGRGRRDAAALVIAVGAGFVILVPSLWYLYRLVLQGQLDQEYEPLDQRFGPAGAGDAAAAAAMRRVLELVGRLVLCGCSGGRERGRRGRRARAAAPARPARGRPATRRRGGRRARPPRGPLVPAHARRAGRRGAPDAPLRGLVTRLAGVLALFAFIIAGVFLSPPRRCSIARTTK